VENCTGDVKLNLGCGAVRWRGWTNIDFDQGDMCGDLRELDMPNNSVDAIAAIHVIEHFHEWEVPPMLKEWLRVLKPGGRLILELPSMDKVLNYLFQSLKKNKPISPAMSWFVFWGDPKYQDPLMVHKWGYTTDMLQAAVHSAGFTDIQFCEPRYHFPMRDMRLEATKPC
jgi:ubiquinone/menaquinone biosynthesis C-methylase UbiE